MLIPLHEGRLLLPNAAVAEVIGYRDPEPTDQQAHWLQGMVAWRQRQIPVIDFEALLGRPDVGAGIRQRIAVCYALQTDAAFAMLGLVAQGIPRLLRVSRASIESAEASPGGDSPVQMTLSIGDEKLLVPDLDYLQAQLPAG
jgi:chemosensory pili system protein ChpC